MKAMFFCAALALIAQGKVYSAEPQRLAVFQQHLVEWAAQSKLPLPEIVKAAKALGITGVEVMSRDDSAAVQTVLAEGMKVSHYVLFTDFAHNDSTDAVEQAFAFCAQNGVKDVMLVPGYYSTNEMTKAEAWSAMCPRIRNFVREAQKHGLSVDLEDFDWFEAVVGSQADLRRAFAAEPALGHVLDTGNYAYWGDDVLAALDEFRSRIRHVHVKDRSRVDPRQSVAAGTGLMPLAEIVRRLERTGYAGWWVIECFGSPDFSRDIAISAEFLKGWRRLDFGPEAVAGYPEIVVSGVTEPATIQVAYSTHPAGLGDRGDFQHETRAHYMGWNLWLPVLPANTDRYDVFTVKSNGVYRAGLCQGLVRYAKWKVLTGEAEVKELRFVNDGVYSQEKVVGTFDCSDKRMNELWRASVRTCQLAAIPGRERPLAVTGTHTSAVLGVSHPFLSDGAKRDRLVWSGDLWFAQRNMYAAFSYDSVFMPGSIRLLGENRTPEGYVQACPYPESHGPLKAGDYGAFPSDEFAAWFVPVLAEHVLYSGDLKLAREQLPVVRDLVAYLVRNSGADLIFEQRLETCRHSCGLTVGGTSLHHRAYMHILLWMVYRDATRLAAWLGEEALRTEWQALATRLANSIRAKFLREDGAIRLSLEEPEKEGWEAEALALASRFATEEEARKLLPRLVLHPHGKFQLLAIRGAFEYGAGAKALELIAAHKWFEMLAPTWPGVRLTSECMNLYRSGWGDEAHPDTALAGELTRYLLGIRPTEPGYRKYEVRPVLVPGIEAASGQVSTPRGMLAVEWKLVNGKLEIKERL